MHGQRPAGVPAAACRARRTAGVRARLALLAGVALLGASACAERQPPLPADLVAWAQGPVRWLMLPGELRQFQHLHDPEAARAFIAEFWRRRELRPDEHEFQRDFEERVSLADRAYSETELRGSLTDRGGALILLGSPSVLRTAPRPARPKTLRGTVRPALQTLEIWGYRPTDLPQILVRKPALAERPEITLEFVVEKGHASLVSGRDLLALAARAAAREP